MAAERSSRRGLAWAYVGGAVLLVGVVAIILLAVVPGTSPSPEPTSSTSPGEATPSPSSAAGVDTVVDASVTERGWVAEPITRDPEAYIRAALAAASTFDTTKSDRSEWLAYLDTWFTLDIRYSSDADRQTELDAARLELRQGVVLPDEEWNSLGDNAGRVNAEAVGEVVFVDVPNDPSGDMFIGTSDVVLTFAQDDGAGEEVEFEETVRVSVQVLCGPESIPTPDSAQQAGDCKVIRYFTEPLEP